MADYLPTGDTELLAWGQSFSQKLTATPTAYGITAANAAQMASNLTAYSTALAAALDPATRGPSKVLAKDTARATMVAYIRLLARAIQGTLTVTNQQRQDLGLTVRDTQPTPVPPPSLAPDIDIVSVFGNAVRLRLHDATNPAKRGKPSGCAGAAVFSHVGATPPDEQAEWKFEGNVTRTSFEIISPEGTAPGSKVWFTAFWFNPRQQKGPAATPATTNIPGGSAMAA